MSPIPKQDRELSRQEAYKDYEERDIEEGWPYSDAAGVDGKAPGNAAYGATDANFDEETNGGVRTVNVDADGGQPDQVEALEPQKDLEDSDDLEERVTDAISNLGDIDMDSIEVQAHGTVIVLEGSVDDISAARRVVLCAQAVSGVHDVRSKLQLLGVDSGMPEDD